MSRIFFVCSLVVSLPATALASAEPPRVVASSVESNDTAEIVRLGISPIPESVTSKIVCGDDSIRVRFDELDSGEVDIKDLKVPAFGPMKKVRLVPRLGKKTVVQIFMHKRTMAACSRTSVMTMEDQIVISTALSDADKKVMTKESEGLSETNRATNEVALSKDTAQAETPKADRSNDSTSDTSEKGDSKGDNPLHLKKASDIKNPLGLADGEGGAEEGSSTRYLAGIGFALLVAGIAWYLKKRKSGIAGNIDSIDILSSKKLNAHQSLIVAKVHESRFLLAVGDKTVTNLGMIPDQEALPSDEFVQDATMYSNARRQGGMRVVPQNNVSFSDLMNMEMGVGENNGRSKRTVETPVRKFVDEGVRNDSTLTNVSGLISMARMRSTLKQQGHRSFTPEA